MKNLVLRRERRGLTWDELAEESGVPKSTLQWWKRRLDKEGSSGFVEIEILEPEPDDTALEVIVAPTEHRVRVAAGFCPDHLCRLVRTLSSC